LSAARVVAAASQTRSLYMALLLATTATAFSSPPAKDGAAFARWMVSTVTWGTLSTSSTRSEGTNVGAAFGNPYSIADVAGVPYVYASGLDASAIDLFGMPSSSPLCSLTLSEATVQHANGTAVFSSCEIGTPLGDPENPPCARLVLTGTMANHTSDQDEEKAARAALFGRHPYLARLPVGHDFFVAKLQLTGLWLIDRYGGAATVTPADYFAAASTAATLPAVPKPALAAPAPGLRGQTAESALPPPWFSDKAATARWVVNSLEWGVLSTISTRSGGTTVGAAFGNPYSYADVDGVPYFYASSLDASMVDLFGAGGRPNATLSLSEAALLGPKGFWWKQKCEIGQPLGDPENPPCARLVLTGTMVKPDAKSDEVKRAMAALLARHPSFANYPSGHGFYVAKMEISAAWEIDMFGGAAIISPADYFKAKP